jgi:hypothetical protein
MKVVIWGHPLHSHTHSYIHEAFHKAFQLMGHDCVWLPDRPVDPENFNDCLFLTEGQADKHMPVKKNCRYILHNCDGKKYADVLKKSLILQVYTHDVRDRAKDNPNYTKIAPCTYVEKATDCKVLYQPWATDLMPNEISFDEAPKDKYSYWIGTIGGGQFGNENQINPFKRACEENGVVFHHATHLSAEQNRNLTATSYLAPAIVGAWQLEKGYIPCRMFKNVSYGQVGLTNSATVKEVMENLVVCNENTHQLFHDGVEVMNNKELRNAAIDLVKSKHTYVNRISTLLEHLE